MQGGMFRTLGTTLVLLRRLRRRSQAWLARRAGMRPERLSAYESGQSLPQLETLERIFEALEVEPHEFFTLVRFTDSLEERERPASTGISDEPRSPRSRPDAGYAFDVFLLFLQGTHVTPSPSASSKTPQRGARRISR